MLSKSQVKLITSLQQKKYRIKLGLFVVEGVKGVNEFLNSDFKCELLYCTKDYDANFLKKETLFISENELKKISSLKSPNKVLGVFRIPKEKKFREEGLTLALDGINDPGNLGTIIRLCDWFGVEQLICSNDTVDCYNTKVIQSTMGSLARLSIIYTDLVDFLNEIELPIYGGVMNGVNIHKETLMEDGIIVMGNEANGISTEVEKLLENKITIPKYSKIQKTESLNVATATAILLNEFRRN